MKKLSFEHHLFVRYPPPVTDDFLHCLLIFPCSSPQSKPAMWGAWMVEAAMTNLASARRVIPEHTVDSVSTCNTCGTPYTYWCICSSDFDGLAIFSSPLESQLAVIRRCYICSAWPGWENWCQWSVQPPFWFHTTAHPNFCVAFKRPHSEHIPPVLTLACCWSQSQDLPWLVPFFCRVWNEF